MKTINDQLYGYAEELNKNIPDEDLTLFHAVDTGETFISYNGAWHEQPLQWSESDYTYEGSSPSPTPPTPSPWSTATVTISAPIDFTVPANSAVLACVEGTPEEGALTIWRSGIRAGESHTLTVPLCNGVFYADVVSGIGEGDMYSRNVSGDITSGLGNSVAIHGDGTITWNQEK